MNETQTWTEATLQSIAHHRAMMDQALAQLTDDEFFQSYGQCNSVAVILRHLGGNLRSRWTDFLTSDGEKASRNRDVEFQAWQGDRQSLMSYVDDGWQRMADTITNLTPQDLEMTVQIRGESHTVPQAIVRSITHLAYHIGQIMVIARAVHDGDWKWITIAPGKSQQHNQSTWGKSHWLR